MIFQGNDIEILSREYNSDKFSISVRHNHYITKDKQEADFLFKIDSRASNNIAIIKEMKDPSDTHPYSFNTVIIAVAERLAKNKVKIGYEKGFNAYVLNMFVSFYGIKAMQEYAYKHVIGKKETYSYSQQFVEFVVEEAKKYPDSFVEGLKAKKG